MCCWRTFCYTMVSYSIDVSRMITSNHKVPTLPWKTSGSPKYKELFSPLTISEGEERNLSSKTSKQICDSWAENHQLIDRLGHWQIIYPKLFCQFLYGLSHFSNKDIKHYLHFQLLMSYYDLFLIVKLRFWVSDKTNIWRRHFGLRFYTQNNWWRK